jgi:hypothetical protein
MADRTKIGQAHLLGCSRRLHFARLWAFSALSQSAAAKAAAEFAMIRIFVLVALALAACTGPAPPPLPTGPWKAANDWPGWATWQPTQAELDSLPR